MSHPLDGGAPGATPGATAAAPSAAAALARRARRRSNSTALLRLAQVATWAPFLSLFGDGGTLPLDVRLTACVAWFLCLWPARRYLSLPPSRRPPIPFMPLIGVTFGVYFVLQGVLGETDIYGRFEQEFYVPVLDPSLYRTTMIMVLAGWVLLLLGHAAVQRGLGRARPRQPRENLPALAHGAMWLLCIGMAAELAKRLPFVPPSFRGLLYSTALLNGLAIALLIILRMRRALTRPQRGALYGALALLLFLQVGTAAAQILMLALVVVLAVWLGGGTLSARWVVFGVVALSFAAAIRGVAADQRRIIRRVGLQLTASESAAMQLQMLRERVDEDGTLATVGQGFRAVAQRSALLDLFTDVVRQTPEAVPYWGGETYGSLIGAFVPRFLWPDKPVKMLGVTFGHRYHYLYENDWSTTINLPFLVEFYVNFGVIGVLVGMFLVGVIYATLERFVNVPGQGILVSVCGVGLLVPLVGIEADFSMIFGGLLMNGALFYGAYRFAQLWLRRRGRSKRREPAPGRTAAVGA